ncbi:MAG: adenylate/guanylate cyclase domain-containing protein, partial [Usitatibacter sp.]
AGAAPIAAIREGSGPYSTADTAGYQMPLQFRRPAITVIRLGDLLDGKVPPDTIRGRAIILGSDAASLRDLFEVPRRAATLDGRLPGATVHAHAAAELIDATRDPSTLLELSAPWVGHALLALSAASVALAVVLLNSFALGLLATLAVLLAIGAGAAAATLAGLAVPPLPAALGALLTCATALGLRARREKRDRHQLMGFFGRQVSPEVATMIWENREAFFDHGRIPAQTVHVSVLFADIRSYSTITEQLAPQAMIDWLNRAIGAMTNAVQKNNGVVVRYVGDQVMALYGSPVPSATREAMSRDAIAAVRSGLDMGRLLDVVNMGNKELGLPSTRVRVGVYSGPVIQGGLGTRERFEFTVLGDTVNTAARLESHAIEDDGVTARLLIGGSTLELCGDRFVTQGLGALHLKGKAQMVEVYRVFSEKLSREGTSDEGNAMVGGRDGLVLGGDASRAGAGSGKDA